VRCEDEEEDSHQSHSIPFDRPVGTADRLDDLFSAGVATSQKAKTMALNRDIYWLGRQWTVTASGMQPVDQKRYGAFDVEVSRLRDDALLERVRRQPWVDADDFEQGLTVARQHYPDPDAALVAASSTEETLPLPEPAPDAREVVEQATLPHAQEAHATFERMWRVRVRP
jgi:hypothetical protein